MEDNTYELDDNLKQRAIRIIKECPNLSHVDLSKIAFVKINKHLKGNHVLGRCALLGVRTEFLSNKRFMIEMPYVYFKLNEKQKDIVMEHELMHISEDNKKLIDHDIGEFNEIVDKYGLDWYEAYKFGQKEVLKLKKEKQGGK